MIMERPRFLSLKDRLALYADDLRKRAALLPPGIEREALLKKARQADTESERDDCNNSPGLQPLK